MKADIIGYKPAIWRILLFVADGVISAGLVAWGVLVILSVLRKKEEVAPVVAAE